MLDYETAKKLKDAGFETPMFGSQFIRRRPDGKIVESGAKRIVSKDDEDIECPTLEDLIEFVDGEKMITMYEQMYAALALRKLLLK